MRAVVVAEDGELAWSETETPVPGPGEVRIAVHVAGVNRGDLAQRSGHYPPPPGASPILGLECAGVIDAVGPGTTRWRVGDAVCALLAGGGYAEQVVVPEVQVMSVPEGCSLEQAAALPEVFATAFLCLRRVGELAPGERVLIHAGASGVGTAAVQLCHLWQSPCWVVVGSDEKIARCRELGAEGGSDRHRRDWADAVRAWAGPAGVAVILDPVGAAALRDNQRVLGTDGRLVVIGLLGGRRAELDLGRLLIKRQRILGSTLRSRPEAEKGALCRQLEEEVWPHVVAGRIAPIVEAVLPIEQVQGAHELLQTNATVGKVLLRVR